MHHTAKQRPADHPRSLALPFCGISAVARDVVQRQPGHSMHPSQGSQSCAALFRLSCLVFRLSRTVLFCHPSVLHCLSSFVLQCTRRCLQMISLAKMSQVLRNARATRVAQRYLLNLPFTVAKLHIMLIRAPISVPNHSSARPSCHRQGQLAKTHSFGHLLVPRPIVLNATESFSTSSSSSSLTSSSSTSSTFTSSSATSTLILYHFSSYSTI